MLSQLFALFVCFVFLKIKPKSSFTYLLFSCFFLFVCSFAVVFLGITPRGEIIKC